MKKLKHLPPQNTKSHFLCFLKSMLLKLLHTHYLSFFLNLNQAGLELVLNGILLNFCATEKVFSSSRLILNFISLLINDSIYFNLLRILFIINFFILIL